MTEFLQAVVNYLLLIVNIKLAYCLLPTANPVSL